MAAKHRPGDMDSDPAFTAWRSHLEDFLDLDSRHSDARQWLWEIFTTHGSMPDELLAPLVLDRRRQLTEDALTALLGEASTDLGRSVELHPMITLPDQRETTGQVVVYIDEILSISRLGVFQAIADAVQTYIGERLHLVWPVCEEHHVGTHPAPTDSGVDWRCSIGDHTARTSFAPV
ncbi:hypothetical protein [Actinacidiphila sp. ITFR-21]|uniref:hypothetical protein n=1 Tax=Actinacidiphila sp. ITFR-21 TaxID=3075199 RepID=UPI00288B0A97|nr:hypothetical protein [Streptomyces sp. ITFR-21]WNI14857.1 hypothetical protein RLT57_04445 [Streptomyces sp. ITFR-21]